MSPTIKLNPSTSLLNGCCLTVYCVHRWEWECVCIISDQGHPPPPQCRDHNNIGTMDVADSDKRHRHHQLHLRSVHTYFACYFCILSNGSWNIRQQICFRGYCLSGNFLIRFISLHQPGRQRDWGSVRISDISILWWTERARVLGAPETDRRDTLISYMDLGPTVYVRGRGWCSSVVQRVSYFTFTQRKAIRGWF